MKLFISKKMSFFLGKGSFVLAKLVKKTLDSVNRLYISSVFIVVVVNVEKAYFSQNY